MKDRIYNIAMSPRVFWICLVVLSGSGLASDVPFVFGEGASDLADYSSIQLQEASSSSPDLAGVPSVTSPANSEIMEIPITGGGNTPEGRLKKTAIDLKDELNKKVEPEDYRIRKTAAMLASKYPGDHRIDQINEIYFYLKYGDNAKKAWSYVSDTRGIDSWNYANESLMIGDEANCVGLGDCDDFAVLMAALIESIGGATRIILANNNSIGGHAYTEVYLGKLNDTNNQVEEIIKWLQQEFNTGKIYGHIDTDTKEAWLNLDWGPDEKGNAHPGGPLFPGDRHNVLRIRDKYKLIPLRMPYTINKAPRIISLTPDKNSPKEAGSVVTWTARAKDPENDQILYRFILNGYAATGWIANDSWIWRTTDADIGDNKIEVYVIDGKHAGPNRFDGNKSENFLIKEMDISSPNQEMQLAKLSNPQDAYAWDEIGYNLTIQGRYVEAINAFDKAIVLDPNYFWARNNRGWALMQMKNYEEALKCFDEAIRIDPNLAVAWNNKGWALIMQKKYDDALESIEKAIELDPNYAWAWNNKGWALMEQKKYSEAQKCIDEAIKLDPENAYAWENKGSILKGIGRDEEAEAAFAKAKELGNAG
ncbi:Beta-barrel assembly-enhancing protease [uncultured archaeon]|nr:Beta-barrel assembly-enhancing protease [uncultured archaeon]